MIKVSIIATFTIIKSEILGPETRTSTVVDTLEVEDFTQEVFEKWIIEKKEELGDKNYSLRSYSHSIYQ